MDCIFPTSVPNSCANEMDKDVELKFEIDVSLDKR